MKCHNAHSPAGAYPAALTRRARGASQGRAARREAACLSPLACAAGSRAIPQLRLILVTRRDETQQTELLARFQREGLECKALVG